MTRSFAIGLIFAVLAMVLGVYAISQRGDGWSHEIRPLIAMKSVNAEWTRITFGDGPFAISYDLVGPPGVYECAIHKGCWIVQETDTTSN